jgi:CheY-like chemotaxis protein
LKTSLRIILADDKTNAVDEFVQAFDEMAISTNIVNITDGRILIDFLSSQLIKSPDAIFIDLSVPGKNGLDCLMEIKRIELMKHVPVFIYSTVFHKDILDLLYVHGAFYCMTKPLQEKHSKDTVDEVMAAIVKSKPQPSRGKFVLGEAGQLLLRD